MKRTYWYAAMTKDEAQHSRMIFYEAGNVKKYTKENIWSSMLSNAVSS